MSIVRYQNIFCKFQEHTKTGTGEGGIIRVGRRPAGRACRRRKTDESTEVFKQAGTLLIKVDYNDALAEMEDKLETLELRKQTMTRQEERVMKKLEEMQNTIQAAMQGMGQ